MYVSHCHSHHPHSQCMSILSYGFQQWSPISGIFRVNIDDQNMKKIRFGYTDYHLKVIFLFKYSLVAKFRTFGDVHTLLSVIFSDKQELTLGISVDLALAPAWLQGPISQYVLESPASETFLKRRLKASNTHRRLNIQFLYQPNNEYNTNLFVSKTLN